MVSTFKEISILDLVEYLEPSPKQRGKYICPVCGGHHLSIAKSGKFACYSSDCDPKGIYRAAKQLSPYWIDKRDFDRDGYQKLIEKRAAEIHQQRLAQQVESPSYEQRHREIEEKLSAGQLTNAHRKELHRRGFDDHAIAYFGFWSTSSNKHGKGIAGVIRDSQHRAIGIAYRWDNSPHTRYTFNSRYSHIPNSTDLTIATWQSPAGGIDDGVLYLSEGLIFKPQLAAMRLRGRVIGYGGGSGNIAPRCEAQLMAAIKRFQPRELRVLPDSGWALNLGVRTALQSLVELPAETIPVKFGDWGQSHDEEIGSIDDISPDRLASIQWRDARELLPAEPTLSPKPETKPDLYQQWKAIALVQGEELPGRYFGESLDRIPRSGLALLAGATSSGKTTALKALAELFDQVLYFTSQESTAQQASITILGEGFYRKEKGRRLVRGDSAGSCIAALDDRNSTDWHRILDPNLRTLVIFDEVEAITDVIDRANGEFKSKAESIISQASLLVACSATVGQADLKLLEDVRNEKATVLTLHRAPIKKNIHIEVIAKQNPNKADFNERISGWIDYARNGKPQAVFTGAQKIHSKTGSAWLETRAIQCGLPPEKIVRLDSETMRNPDRRECGFASWSADRQAQLIGDASLVIGTQSVKNGFSLMVEGLTVRVLDGGRLSVKDCIQFLDRFRLSTEVYLYITETDLHNIYGGETNPAKIKRILMREGRAFHGAKASETDSAWLDHHCRAIAEHNIGFGNKGSILDEYNREMGHTVEVREARCGFKGQALQEWIEARAKAQELYETNVGSAVDYTPRGLEEIEEQDTQNTAEYWALLKGNVRRKLDLWGLGRDEDGNESHNVPLPFLPSVISQVEHQQIHKPWKRSFTALRLDETDHQFLLHQNRKYTHRLTRTGEKFNPAFKSIAGQFAVLSELDAIDVVRSHAVTDIDSAVYRDLQVTDTDTDSKALRDELGRRVISQVDPAQQFSIRCEGIQRSAAKMRRFGLDMINYALGTSIAPNDPPKPKAAESDSAYQRRWERWRNNSPVQRTGETEDSKSYQDKLAKWESKGAEPRHKPRLSKPESDDAFAQRMQAWCDREPVQRPAETEEQYQKRWAEMKADGRWAEIDGRQVLTLIRQYFKARTFADRGRHTQHGKGVYALSFDDVLNTFKVKLEETARQNKAIAQENGETSTPRPLKTFCFSDMPQMHRRSDFFDLWKEQHNRRMEQANSESGSLFPIQSPQCMANSDPPVELVARHEPAPVAIRHTAGWGATASELPCKWDILMIDDGRATIRAVHRPDCVASVQIEAVDKHHLEFA